MKFETPTSNALETLMEELVYKKEELKNKLKEVDAKLEVILKALGEDYVFQGKDGVVFKVTKPAGKFISFQEIDYLRTRKEGEKGSNYISKVEATEIKKQLS